MGKHGIARSSSFHQMSASDWCATAVLGGIFILTMLFS